MFSFNSHGWTLLAYIADVVATLLYFIWNSACYFQAASLIAWLCMFTIIWSIRNPSHNIGGRNGTDSRALAMPNILCTCAVIQISSLSKFNMLPLPILPVQMYVIVACTYFVTYPWGCKSVPIVLHLVRRLNKECVT